MRAIFVSKDSNWLQSIGLLLLGLRTGRTPIGIAKIDPVTDLGKGRWQNFWCDRWCLASTGSTGRSSNTCSPTVGWWCCLGWLQGRSFSGGL